MEHKGMEYKFLAKACQYTSSAEDMVSWTIALLPKEMSVEIRENFKWQEEGWGRMKVTAKIGKSQWKTAIWYDTKHDTYFLPLKAEIRKKEKILPEQDIEVIIWV